MTSNRRVHVWFARSRTPGGKRESAWSTEQKAREWIERHAVIEDVDWSYSEDDEAATAEVTGELLGEIRRIEVKDPGAVADMYPDSLPARTPIVPIDELDRVDVE